MRQVLLYNNIEYNQENMRTNYDILFCVSFMRNFDSKVSVNAHNNFLNYLFWSLL